MVKSRSDAIVFSFDVQNHRVLVVGILPGRDEAFVLRHIEVREHLKFPAKTALLIGKLVNNLTVHLSQVRASKKSSPLVAGQVRTVSISPLTSVSLEF